MKKESFTQGEVFILGIGAWLLILYFLKNSEKIELDSNFIAIFSLAGLFFTASDFFQLLSEHHLSIWKGKSGSLWTRRLTRAFSYLLLFLSGGCFIILPISYIHGNKALAKLGDSATLLSMSIILILIVFKNLLQRVQSRADVQK
ncbi:hypothetical protein [Paenibacillus arenilitoris]|uniref:Uncharacterized protein n=1 Tax=Paenibacillus arenilitoris TaxID=2772299 RepID=A0A927CUJ8_9BACL|nr:hypothetical protein [Paenibacillus arenilitoris]MBD2871825.1 hypothetical protein [Paenibacillus arenilitoris]